MWAGHVLPRPKRLKIINHKVNKTMHSTVLRENGSLPSSHAIGNFLFSTYEVVIMSTLHSFLLKITVNSGLWMLMLSLIYLKKINYRERFMCSAAAVLGPPQMLSLVEKRDDTHPKPVLIRTCERSGAWSERGAERAKYSRSAEWVFIQRPERSLCLAPVPLQYRSHHEPRACTNPPRIHLCLQQLTKLSAYTSKIVRCEGEMEFVKYFQKQTDRSYRCTIPVKKNRW